MDKNFTRLVDTLQSLDKDQFLSVAQIQQRLEVLGHDTTVRTVQRDLNELSVDYGLERQDSSKPFGWRWAKDRPRLTLPSMGWPEAVSFRLLEDYLRNLLPASVGQHLKPYFEQARKTLEKKEGGGLLKDWPSKVRVLTPGPTFVEPDVKRWIRDAVSEALLLNRQMSIVYRSVASKGEPKLQTINPLALVMEGRIMYLVASYPKYDEPRELALHRIEKAVVLETPAVPPDGFTLDGYIRAGGFGCGGEVPILLDATWHYKAGIHLIQLKLAAEQIVEEIDGEATRIKANVLHTERLVWWLLSFGDRVEVNGPPELRDEIASIHRAAAKRYVKPKRPSPPSAVA